MGKQSFLRFLNINLYLIFVPSFLNLKIAGFAFQGYLWVFALAYSIYIILHNGKNRFPVVYILPWAFYLIIHLILNFNFIGLQSTLMILSPALIGIAVSGFDYSEISSYDILLLFRKFTNVFILFNFLYSIFQYGRIGVLTNGTLVLSANILAAITISDYYTYYRTRDLVKFALLLLIPVLEVTRMAILMSLILVPLSFIKIKPQLRIFTTILAIVSGLIIFYSQPLQKKMFYTGEGTFRDLSTENNNFRTSGRTMVYNLLSENIKESNKLFGKGPRSDLFLLKQLNLPTGETHNDYISTVYNYGFIGLGLFLLYNLLYFLAVFRIHKIFDDPDFLILTATCLIIFITYAGFLSSDNAIRYNIYFTNIHFILMGIIFAISRTKEALSDTKLYV